MPLAEYFGWSAALISVVSGLPQIFRLWRERDSEGLSITMWQLYAAALGGWTIYSFKVMLPQLIVPNTAGVLTGLLVLWFIARDRGLRWLRLAALPLALAVALFLVDVAFGALAFGLVVAVPLAVGQLAQLREMTRSKWLTGVSLSYLALFVVVQTLWLVYGFMIWDWAIIGCDTIMGTLCLANFCYFVYRMSRGTAHPPRAVAA